MRSSLSWSLLLVLFSCLPGLLGAQTVRSECNGVWSDTKVWGGTVPSAGDSIVVRHKVKNVDPIVLDQNYIRIEAKAGLCGYHPLEIPKGSKLHNHGFLGLSSMDLKDSLINFSSGTVLADSQITITGYFHNDGGAVEVGTYSCFDKPTCTPAIYARSSSDSLRSNTAGPHFQWFLDGSPLSDTTRTIPSRGAGTYKVRILHDNGDTTAYSPPYEYDPTGLVRSDRKEAELSVRPNPSDGHFTVDLSVPGRLRRLMVFGPHGRKLFEKSPDRASLKLDLSDRAPGIYFLRTIGRDDQVGVKKLLIR